MVDNYIVQLTGGARLDYWSDDEVRHDPQPRGGDEDHDDRNDRNGEYRGHDDGHKDCGDDRKDRDGDHRGHDDGHKGRDDRKGEGVVE